MVVECYRTGKYTAAEIAREFRIGSAAAILNWVHKAEQFGYDGLIPKQRGAVMPKRKPPVCQITLTNSYVDVKSWRWITRSFRIQSKH
jgi:transposase-like protein